MNNKKSEPCNWLLNEDNSWMQAVMQTLKVKQNKTWAFKDKKINNMIRKSLRNQKL